MPRRKPKKGPEPTSTVAFEILHKSVAMRPDLPWAKEGLAKALLILTKEHDKDKVSRQSVDTGRKAHPFCMDVAAYLQTSNVHHGRCVNAKKQAMVGLGFKNKKVAKILNPLTKCAFQVDLTKMGEDFVNVANGYFEVVRNKSGKMTGIYHVQAPSVHIVIEDELYHQHFEVKTDGETRLYAVFGDLKDFKKRNKDMIDGQTKVAELIHIPLPSALDRWYGFVDWIAAVGSIELKSALDQHNYDFFVNRGVPEFMLFVLGGVVPKEDWAKITAALKSQTGRGNAHKSIALNFSNKDVTIKLEKLAAEGANAPDMFKNLSETLALETVSAHGVPPLLAGIQIPGKLGANNELPNALTAFQVLVIGPYQKVIEQVLDCTLGDNEKSGLGLKPGDFKFVTILDEIDIGTMQTVGSMRETVPEARAKGRDPKDGLLKNGRKTPASQKAIQKAFLSMAQEDRVDLIKSLALAAERNGSS